jgi:hypothetical protein
MTRFCLPGGGEILGLAASADRIAIAHGTEGLVMLDRVTLARVPGPTADASGVWFSPDGRQLGVLGHRGSALMDFFIIDLATGAHRVLIPHAAHLRILAWSARQIVTVDAAPALHEVWHVDPASGTVRARTSLETRTATAVGTFESRREGDRTIIVALGDDLRPSRSWSVAGLDASFQILGAADRATVLGSEDDRGEGKRYVLIRDGVISWRHEIGRYAIGDVLTLDGGQIAVTTMPNYKDEGACGVLVLDSGRPAPRRIEGPTDCVMLADPTLSPDRGTLYAEQHVGRTAPPERCIVALDL